MRQAALSSPYSSNEIGSIMPLMVRPSWTNDTSVHASSPSTSWLNTASAFVPSLAALS